MLKNLKIKNFRSIVEADISFGDLTVLIGANGSGKSNIFKVVEFISQFVMEGLDKTIPTQNHFNSIIPKITPSSEVNSTVIKFDYSIEHREKDGSIKRFNHVIEIKHSDKANRVCDVLSESITFIDPFVLIGRQAGLNSKVTVSRTATSPITVEVEPRVTAENFDVILKWFGLAGLKDLVGLSKESKPEDFPAMIDLIFKTNQDSSPGTASKSLVGGEIRTLLGLIVDLPVFKSELSKIENYNFFSKDLRRAYPPAPNAELSSSGKNMPSVFKRIRATPSLQRIQSTLSEIAPHIQKIGVNEEIPDNSYVEFGEKFLERPVATFDSSEGTLRALAMMLAIETHPRGTTMIIEEPEQNLHPWAIEYIIDFAREVIKDHGIQVILSTHSEHVLKWANPEEVLVVSRNSAIGTRVRTIQEILPEGNLEMGEVGRQWMKGNLGGVPGK